MFGHTKLETEEKEERRVQLYIHVHLAQCITTNMMVIKIAQLKKCKSMSAIYKMYVQKVCILRNQEHISMKYYLKIATSIFANIAWP